MYYMYAVKDGDGWTAVRWAAKGGRSKVIHALCRWGGDPNSRDFEGWYIVMAAALDGKAEVCMYNMCWCMRVCMCGCV